MMKKTTSLILFVGLGIIFSISANTFNVIKGNLDVDKKFVWYKADMLGVEGKGWEDTELQYSRLPLRAKGMVRPPIWDLSLCSAGLLIRFATDARQLEVRWTLTTNQLTLPHMPATGVSGIDLYYRDKTGKLKFSANGRPLEISNRVSLSLPPSDEYVLYLPLYNGVKHLELGIPPDKTLSCLPKRSQSQSIVFYGTSITQGACASRPGMAATAMVGRELDVPVINLGFSSNGKMEKEMAVLLAELDPAVYVLDCLWNMDSQLVSERVEPFINILREKRPATPILLVEDASFRDQPSEKGDILRKIYAKLTNAGEKNLYFLSNKGMLGEDADGTVDGCHPNDLGMNRQAFVFIESLKPLLNKKK